MATPLRRYEQIAAVFVKYGFEMAVADILPNTIRWRLRRQKSEVSNQNVNRRIRLAIQELGPTFVKFGQIMSTRRELLTPELVRELRLLTDSVEPVAWEKVRPTIEEYCGPIEQTFVYLNKRPFAAASLSQAHHGKLMDGTVVVLKVQRPGIRQQIETDLRILMDIAKRTKTSNELQIFNFPGMVVDFARQIMAELDFTRDGRNADILARNMREFEGIRVPKIYWQYSGQRLLTMEYMKGIRIDMVAQIKKLGLDPKTLAMLGFKAYMKQIFEDGFFHGDPHPGNLLITPDGKLVFLDFGMMGVLRPEKRDLLLKMLLSIMNKNVDDLVDVFNDLGIAVRERWLDAFKDDLYLSMLASDEAHVDESETAAIEGVVESMRKYRLKVPMVTMLMIKVLVMVQDDYNLIYPEFDFVGETKLILSDVMKRRLFSQATLQKSVYSIIDAFQNATDLPENVNETFKRLSTGKVTMKIAHDDLDRIGNSIDRASYKLLLGLLLASIVIGMSLIVIATQNILTEESFLLTIGVYAVVVLVGVFSVFQLIRQRDKR